jgi:DNA-binding MarR family transcriptional regulator
MDTAVPAPTGPGTAPASEQLSQYHPIETEMADPSPETPPATAGPTIQGRAWRSLLETHRELMTRVEHEFKANTPLELQQYDVLFHVSEASDGVRMTDLANAVVLTKSGLTSLVDRMEEAKLIERRPDPQDRRATRIHLTPVGEEELAAASQHHREVVRQIWTSRTSDEEATVIAHVLARVRTGLLEESSQG